MTIMIFDNDIMRHLTVFKLIAKNVECHLWLIAVNRSNADRQIFLSQLKYIQYKLHTSISVNGKMYFSQLECIIIIN